MLRVLDEHAADKVFELLGIILLNRSMRIVDYCIDQTLFRFIFEGIVKCTELISNDADGPYILLCLVWFETYCIMNLGSHILFSSFIIVEIR